MKVRQYQTDLYNHVQNVLQTPFKHIVKLERRVNYSSNKVQFFVSVEERPQINKKQSDGNFIYGKFKEQKLLGAKNGISLLNTQII